MPAEFAEKYPTGVDGQPVEYTSGEDNGAEYVVTGLHGKYTTDDPEEEVLCPFLDKKRGCTLPAEDKPFDCSIWPLRCMRMPDGELRVCLTPTCPEINKVPVSRMEKLLSEGLGERILQYAKRYPFMIKEYKDGFTVLNY